MLRGPLKQERLNDGLSVVLCGSPAQALHAFARKLAESAAVACADPDDSAIHSLGLSGAAFAANGRSFLLQHASHGPHALNEFVAAAFRSELTLVRIDVDQELPDNVRHELAAARFVGIRDAVIAVDGLDRTGWDRAAFAAAAAAFRPLTEWLGFRFHAAIPVSSALGDNLAARSPRMPWYRGPTLVDHFESIAAARTRTRDPVRFAVQKRYPEEGSFCIGKLVSGALQAGDELVVARTGRRAKVARLLVAGKDVERVAAQDEAAIAFAADIAVESGDVLSAPGDAPERSDQFAAHLVWLDSEPLLPGRSYELEIGFRNVQASVTALKHRVSTEKLDLQSAKTLRLGEIGLCNIATEVPVELDSSPMTPAAGGFVLRRPRTAQTLAVGAIDYGLRRSHNLRYQVLDVSKRVRASLKAQEPCVVWFTGLSGAGKSTLANRVESLLAARGRHTYLMDGDNVRHGLNKDLGFTSADRVENIRRIGEVSKLFVDAGLIVLCAFISPFRAERAQVRSLLGPDEFIEVFVDAPLSVCEARDPKGLYAKSRAGLLPNFTGVDSPYEPPEHPDLVLNTASAGVDTLAERVLSLLSERGRLLGSSIGDRNGRH